MKAAAAAVLGDSVMPLEDLVAAMAGQGYDDPDEVVGVLRTYPDYMTVSDGAFLVGPRLDGTQWTAFVPEDTAALDVVPVEPHLSVLAWWLIFHPVDVIDERGENIGPVECTDHQTDERDIDVLQGPPGWLEPYAGKWVSVAVAGDRMHWAVLAEPPAATAAQADAVRGGFQRSADVDVIRKPGHDEVVLRSNVGDAPLLEALARDRDAMRATPLAPLPELYAAAGLQMVDAWVLPADVDVELFRWWRERDLLGKRFDVDTAVADVVVRLLEMADPADGEEATFTGDAADAETVAAVFDDERAARALAEEVTDRVLMPEDVEAVIDGIGERIDRSLPPGLVQVWARMRDLAGDAESAETAMKDLMARGCRWPSVVLTAAAYAADRSDAAAAWDLLRSAGALETDLPIDAHFDPNWRVGALLKQEVEGYIHRRGPALAGRNDPCPCGSGRKYKVCHLGREIVPLEERASWLYDKARRFLRSYFPEALSAVTESLVAGFPEPPSMDFFEELEASPFVADLAMREMNLFAPFVVFRRELLPEDEAALADRWIGVERSIYALVKVGRGSVLLHDLRSGDQLTVESVQMSGDTPQGTMLVGRPLPVGDGYRAFGGFMTVPEARAEELLRIVRQEDALQTAAAIGSLFSDAALGDDDMDDDDGE